MAPLQPQTSAQREPGREVCRGSGVPHRLAQSLPLRPKGIWNRERRGLEVKRSRRGRDLVEPSPPCGAERATQPRLRQGSAPHGHGHAAGTGSLCCFTGRQGSWDPVDKLSVRTLRAGTSPGSGCLTNCTAQQSGAPERPFSLPRGSGSESLRATSRDRLHFPSEAGGLKGLHIPVD